MRRLRGANLALIVILAVQTAGCSSAKLLAVDCGEPRLGHMAVRQDVRQMEIGQSVELTLKDGHKVSGEVAALGAGHVEITRPTNRGLERTSIELCEIASARTRVASVLTNVTLAVAGLTFVLVALLGATDSFSGI